MQARRRSKFFQLLKGLALSLFVRSGPYAPAVKEVRSCHSCALALFGFIVVLQLTPRPWFIPTLSTTGTLVESSLLAAIDLVAVSACTFWFWLYFADRQTEHVQVRPLLFGRAQDVVLGLPDVHTSQFILVALPLMLASLVALTAAMVSQAGFLLATMTSGGAVTALLAIGDNEKQCGGFGELPHRAFLAIFSVALGGDNPCLKLSTESSLGAALSFVLWIMRAIFAAVAFGVFVQFGTVIVRRGRGQ